MTEPFFAGSVSAFPMWSGIPWGLQQPPFSGASGSIGTGMTSFGSPPMMPGTPITAAPFGVPTASTGALTGFPPVNYGVAPPLYGPGAGLTFGASPGLFPSYGIPVPWTGFGQAVPSFSGSPPFGGQEMAAGVPASALVSVIAMKRGQPMGPTNDREIEEVIYDALEWLSGTNEVEARCEGGRITLTGSVSNKRIKRDVGEVAWAIPSVTDVQNTVTITARRRGRHDQREQESQPATAGRKQA
jgi:BON domain-containing protein